MGNVSYSISCSGDYWSISNSGAYKITLFLFFWIYFSPDFDFESLYESEDEEDSEEELLDLEDTSSII